MSAPAPTEREILFNAEMVRAILTGRKITTLRTQGLEQVNNDDSWVWTLGGTQEEPKLPYGKSRRVFLALFQAGRLKDSIPETKCVEVRCPFGAVGDKLWVRETWLTRLCLHCDNRYEQAECTCSEPPIYKASWDTTPVLERPILANDDKWKPSIHMPRWASRITLLITEIDVVRTLDLQEGDARMEGCYNLAHLHLLWDATLKSKRFKDNPWTWRITFRALEVKA